MCFFHFITIVLVMAEIIEPAYSNHPVVPLQVNAKKYLFQEGESKEATRFRKLDANSKFRSFPFRKPLQNRIPSFHKNGLRMIKQQSLIPLNNRGKYSETAQPRPAVEKMGNYYALHRSNKNASDILKRPISFPPPRTKYTSNAQLGALNTLHNSLANYGKPGKGNQEVNVGSVPDPSTLVNFNGNNIALLPQLKDDSANEGDLLVTSIVQIGKPLMIRPGVNNSSNRRHDKLEMQKAKYSDRNQTSPPLRNSNVKNTLHRRRPANISAHLVERHKPVHGQEMHSSNKMTPTKLLFDELASKDDDLLTFLESIHNSKTAPQLQNVNDSFKGRTQGELVKGVHSLNLTKNFHPKNKTTSQNDMVGHAVPWKQISKGDHSDERNHNGGSNQFRLNQGKIMLTGFKNQNGESDHVERVSGFDVGGIQNHSHFGSFRARINVDLLKQGSLSTKLPFAISKQNQTTAIGIHKNKKGQRAEGFGRGHLDTESNFSKGSYELLNGRYDHDPEEIPFTSEQGADKTRYPGQDQDEYTEEYDVEDNSASPTTNQRYVPVDEFGSPFYGNETDDFFRREALAAHNRYRIIHKAPPLKLDPQLSLEAERFAKHLAQLGGARHEIRANLKREGEGENVARGCSEWGGLTASGAVHRWYSQVCSFDWNKRTIQPNAESFMQIAWKGTSRMGIGRAMGTRMGSPCTFIVARYRPGDMNANTVESNIDKGIFLPSYCNADVDEGLMSTGYPSSFLAEGRPSKIVRHFHAPLVPATELTYVPMNSWGSNIDEQGTQGLFNEPEPDTQASNSFLPHLSYVGSQFEGEKMMMEDDAVKREYKPFKTTN